MPPRPTWKGFLRLSLVTVPVRAHTATSSGAEIRLNQLHRDCNQRIKYQKTCPEHGQVTGDDIVSGYEYARGQYVVVDLEELRKLRPERDNTIRIDGFVDAGRVETRYHAGRTYYLLPDGAVGQKPYALLRRAMQQSQVDALAQVVLSGREQLVLVQPLDDLLVMTVLHQESKVKQPDEYRGELAEQELTEAELALTKTLIDATKLTDFDYGGYRDAYVERLTRLIQAKVDGEELVEVRDPEEPKILNLMEALKQSVARAQSG